MDDSESPFAGMPLCRHKVQFDCERCFDWEDRTAPPNGIGPVCKHCHQLIDGPSDHKMDCVIYPVQSDPSEPLFPVHEVKTHVMYLRLDIPVLNTWERLGMTETVMHRIIRNIEDDLMYYRGSVNLFDEWDEELDDDD